MNEKKGIAVPTALFFVIFVFFISTVMAARAHMNLRVSHSAAEGVARQLAARGAAAQALVELNKDEAWRRHDSNDPVTFSLDPLVTEGWVERDPDNPLIHHVFGRAFPLGQEEQAAVSTRIVLRRPDVEGVTFTNAPVLGQHIPDSLFYKKSYDEEWSLLPPAPRWTYDQNRNLVRHSGYAGSINNLAADDHGRL